AARAAPTQPAPSWRGHPQYIDIESQGLNLSCCQTLVPGRHVAGPTAVYGLDDVFYSTTIKPGRIGQVRRSDIGYAGAAFTVTSRAIIDEQLLARCNGVDIINRRIFGLAH